MIDINKANLKEIKFIISDVDDTITTNGKLHPVALEAMYKAVENGLKIILVTGGSAGWADVYIRQWPINYVITESGALLLYKDENGVAYKKNPKIIDSHIEKKNILERKYQEYLSSDQYSRLYDVAVDLTKVNEDKLKEIEEDAGSLGAYIAKSSIHMNIWFSPYDKKEALLEFSPDLGLNDEIIQNNSIYIGDGLNDQVLFNYFKHSAGVKSVEENILKFSYLPKYCSQFHGGQGFNEIVTAVLKQQENK